MNETRWRIGIGSIQPRTGQAIKLSKGLNILVGPNNAGKTSLLQDLQFFSQNFGADGGLKILHYYVSFTEGLADEASSWLFRHKRVKEPFKWGKLVNREHHPEPVGLGGDAREIPQSVWDSDVYFPYLGHGHITIMNVRNRLQLVDPVSALDPTRDDFPFNAIQVMYEDDALEARWTALVERAFGKSVSIWRDAGPTIRLMSGKPKATIADRSAYQEEMRSKAQLSSEGDGLVAYAGIMLQLVADDNPVVMIDEPEAFLHPPQSRLIGQELASISNQGKQVIVATHSTDIVKGAFAAASHDNLNIMRITRDGDANSLQRIPEDTLRGIVLDPLLRHSDLLDGLFYDGVILTESDGDATYYGLVFEALYAKRFGTQIDGLDEKRPDILFTHSNGGYSRFPQALRALRSLGVPSACVLDVDVLGNTEMLERILNSLNSSIGLLGVQSKLANISNTLSQRSTAPTRENLRKITEPILKSRERYLSDGEVRQIRSVVSAQSGWRHGASQFDLGLRGDELRNFLTIVDALKSAGVFVVRAGQLEGFHTEFNPEPKAMWLASVIESGAFAREGSHQHFIEDIVAYLAPRGTSGRRADRTNPT